MLNKEELRQRVVELGLEKYWPNLEKLVRPAIYREGSLIKDDQLTIGASKSGGIPDVPPGFVWPSDEDGFCVFLCQINLEEIASFDIENLLPKTGILSFFHSGDGSGGVGSLSKDPVFYFPEITALTRAIPHYSEEKYIDEQYYEDCLELSFYSGWSLPDTEEKFDFEWDASITIIKKSKNMALYVVFFSGILEYHLYLLPKNSLICSEIIMKTTFWDIPMIIRVRWSHRRRWLSENFPTHIQEPRKRSKPIHVCTTKLPLKLIRTGYACYTMEITAGACLRWII